jgi:hypothetical protein
MLFSKQINIKFLLFKKLSIIGLFKIKNLEIFSENSAYNTHVSYFDKKICSISMGVIFDCMNKLYPLINLLLLKKSVFLFINIDKNQNGFLTKIFYSLLKKIRAYCVYDWGYGLLTNYTRTYYEFFLEKKEELYKFPDIIFLLRILEKQQYVMTEVTSAGTLSLGLVDYGNSAHIDYPIPSNTSSEYSYFFFKLLGKLIKNSTIMVEQDLDTGYKKKIKRLEILINTLYENTRKDKFKITSNYKKK